MLSSRFVKEIGRVELVVAFVEANDFLPVHECDC